MDLAGRLCVGPQGVALCDLAGDAALDQVLAVPLEDVRADDGGLLDQAFEEEGCRREPRLRVEVSVVVHSHAHAGLPILKRHLRVSGSA